MLKNIKVKDMLEDIKVKGWCKLSKVYSTEFTTFAKDSIEELSLIYKSIQEKKGLFKEAENSFHHICVLRPELVERAFNDKLYSFLENYFKGKFILNSFGSTKLRPYGKTYTQIMHRDARDINSSKDMLNLIILLDDSTPDNGATKVLEGSHLLENFVPERKYFDKHSINISGHAGDIIIFNPFLWHATGSNTSNKSRTIITPMVTRPFIKSGLDYVRAIGNDQIINYSTRMKQLFGYYSRTASNLEEFYEPREKRMYRSDQK